MHLLEQYLKDMYEIHSTGGGVEETSYYPPLATLLNEIGKRLTPKVKCVCQLKNTGAGNPDFGLFTAGQLGKGKDADPLSGQLPERGVIEAKPVNDDSWVTADGKQVSKYWKRYSQVLVTNYRDFVFVGRDDDQNPIILETFQLAVDENTFWNATHHAHKTATEKGNSFVEYLQRVMQYSAAVKNPADLAWFLASYAREARMRIEAVLDLPGLALLRKGLEDALGMKFDGKDGEHFFRATLIQTLFYGVFSSWVLWARNHRGKHDATFDWKTAAWDLHVPMIASLFDQIATPKQLKPLGIDEVLDWAGRVLNRVDRKEFFRQFEEEHAVQYFYEPFLEAYDPDLRKELGVWYTPPEIVKYQVERVDTVLREELGIADGLADEHVVVLDPCCGTGAYLVEVLKKIHQTLESKGGDALMAAQLKKAATHRIFGFEILPAPFVISHLQLGLLLRELGAPLSDKKNERAGVYLTNALTGWEPPKKPKDALPFPELQEEKDAAEKVKREAPILVILGNPPYNAFSGTSPEEEGGLVDAYKEGLNTPVKEGGWGIKKFNLDDLYVRFFRIAERRIVKGGKGVVSFISNHSWVSEPSFVVLRKNLLEMFDKFWIENMHGNRKISEYGPDGRTSETVFAIAGFSAGIQQGVATSLWVKTGKSKKGGATVLFRDDIDASKASDRRKQLLATLAEKNLSRRYKKALPVVENRFSFRPSDVTEDYLKWPKVTDFCEVAPSNGPIERRGNSLIAFQNEAKHFDCLKKYLNPKISNEEIEELIPQYMKSSGEFDALKARDTLKGKVVFNESKIVRYPFKPFDIRLAYLDVAIAPLFSRPSPVLLKHKEIAGNFFFITRDTADKNPEGPPFLSSKLICDYDSISGHSRHFPCYIVVEKKKSKDDDGMTGSLLGEDLSGEEIKANLSDMAREYLKALGLGNPDTHREVAELVWMHSLAIGYSGAYLRENADGIRQDWPRIPLPDSKKALLASAGLGRRTAALLDTEAGVDGVTTGTICKELACIGLVSRVGGGAVNADAGELDVTAGWGHGGKDGVCMPGKGKAVTRAYSEEEQRAIAAGPRAVLGEETCDVYLNDRVFIRNVPVAVWEYTIGGYQVVKKWLSYREKAMLGRGLTMDEVMTVREMVRRLSALVLLGPELDKNYAAVIAATFAWGE